MAALVAILDIGKERYSNFESPCHSDASHQLYLTYDLEGDVSAYLGYQNRTISESLCCSNASHQVSAQSYLLFGKCHLKIFKMATMVAILDIGMN